MNLLFCAQTIPSFLIHKANGDNVSVLSLLLKNNQPEECQKKIYVKSFIEF